MSKSNARKIGFFSALSICFTSIVGIGIFLKNASVGKNVSGNGISWLITWIISGILAIALAYHFGRISVIESKKGLTGLTAWTNEIADKKNNWFKRIVSVNYGFFYNPILLISLSFFCSEFFVLFLQTVDSSISFDIWVYVLISLLFLLFFVLNNYFSVKFSGYISMTTTVLKFIPLLMVIFIGLIFANTHNLVQNNSLKTATQNGFEIKITFDKALQGIMLSIPSVLFAFDSFVGVGSWSTHIKGGNKVVSRVIVSAMILVTIVYSLICLASIFHYNATDGTTILNVLLDSLPSSTTKGITIFISLFIFISAFGTSNSIAGTTLHEFKNMIIGRKVMFVRFLSKHFNKNQSSLFLGFILITIWSLIMFIPTILINSDALIDGFSNIVVLTIFLVYSYIIFLFWKNVYKKSNKEIKKSYSIFVWLTILAVMIVSFLNIFFVFFEGIKDFDGYSNWGLLLSGDSFGGIKNLYVMIFYASFIFIYIVFPWINEMIVKRRLCFIRSNDF